MLPGVAELVSVSFEAVNKICSFPVPQFVHLQNGDNESTEEQCLQTWYKIHSH